MHIGEITATPIGEWAVQQARNLALSLGERFEDIKFLIRDHGPDFTASFDAVFQAAGTRILHTAVQAPRMNAICERLVGTLRREFLDRVLIHGECHLRTILAEYQVHYNAARPHQGIAPARPRWSTRRRPPHRCRLRPRTALPKTRPGQPRSTITRAPPDTPKGLTAHRTDPIFERTGAGYASFVRRYVLQWRYERHDNHPH
jgi:transposase InsO family protein